MAKLTVRSMGLNGVNVDKNPLELADNELQQGQNSISDPAAGMSTLRKRPGLLRFTTEASSGTVLGGIGLPLVDASLSGIHYLYIGRGPTS